MGTCGSKPHTQDIDIIHRKQLECSRYEDTDEPTYDFTEGKVLKVYDGDTLTLAVFDHNRLVRYNVRLYGIDCAEMKGSTVSSKRKATEAKKFVENMILNKIVKINILNNKTVDGSKIKDKYGRLLAIIYYNNINVADELLRSGLATEYYGGSKIIFS